MTLDLPSAFRAALCVMAFLSLQSCAYRLDITRDPDFEELADKQFVTSNAGRKLRLYGYEYMQTAPLARRDLTTVDQGEDRLIMIPEGTPVKIEKIIEFHDIGIKWKELWGELFLNGRIYPFRFNLDTLANPDDWRRRFYKSFKIRP